MSTEKNKQFNPTTAKLADIVNFLEISFRQFNDTQSRWSFEPITKYIGYKEELAYDFSQFLNNLENKTTQKRWHSALIKLICDNLIDSEDTAMLVIDIAVLVNESRLLKVLPILIEADFASEQLLDRVVDVVYELPIEQDNSVNALSAAIKSDKFPVASASGALLALCRIVPDNWLEYLRMLTTKIKPSQNEFTPTSFVQKHAAKSLLNLIGLNRLARNWYQLCADTDTSWLAKILVDTNEPLVEIDGLYLTSQLFKGERVLIESPLPIWLNTLDDSLAKLRVNVVGDAGFKRNDEVPLSIDNHVVYVSSQILEKKDISTAEELFNSLTTKLEDSADFHSPVDRNYLAKAAIGQLVLEAINTETNEPPKPIHMRDSGSNLGQIVSFISHWHVKEDGRRKLKEEGDFNMSFEKDAVRIPPKIWSTFGPVDNVATFVNHICEAGNDEIHRLGWDNRRFERARVHAIGQIFSNALENKVSKVVVANV